MARNRDIVATRKLNDNNKAKLGRGGDTKIRTVDGKKSHVNAFEAYMIDVKGKAGEEYTKKVGSGEINPYTGMPEYHWKANWKHMEGHARENIGVILDLNNPITASIRAYEYATDKETGFNTLGELLEDPSKKMVDFDTVNENLGLTEPEEELKVGKKLSFQELKDLQQNDPEGYTEYLETWGLTADDAQFISEFEDKPFEFLGEQQALTEEDLEIAYGATMGGLESQQATLGRTTGRGFKEAAKGRDITAGQANMAFSGTITQAYETQKKGLFQDYTAGTQDISRQKGTALETLQLGKEGADLDFRQADYLEKQRQADQFYTDIMNRKNALG